MENSSKPSKHLASRRSILLTGLALGAGATGSGLLTGAIPAFAASGEELTSGDAAILRFLSALEIIETDLWQQYNELGGVQDGEVPGGSGNTPYTDALSNLDEDMAQYIHDNTEDEFTHASFLNTFLMAHGAQPVSLEMFRRL